MSDVKKFFINISIFLLLLVLILLLFWFTITQIPNKKFHTRYQYAINTKYKKLLETDGPKVIILGGSSGGFGINTKAIEEKVGMPVVNLALHAGFGLRFNAEIAKGNIQEGDIVVLAYEYALLTAFDSDSEIIVSGIDNNIEMYKYIPIDFMPNVIKYFPTYTLKKIDSLKDSYATEEEYGIYTLNSFDKDGNMIHERGECVLPDNIPENYNYVDIKENAISSEVIDYLNTFTDYVRGKGADIVLTFPPVIDERFYGTDEEIESYEKNIDDNLNVTRISNVRNYVFEREYMYDTIYHLNSSGELVRSERLADDILNYLQKSSDE